MAKAAGCLRAEGDFAGVGVDADGGVETEELPQTLAARAAVLLLLLRRLLLAVAGGEVVDELLEATAGGRVRAMGGITRRRSAAGWPDLGAALRADVLQALHGLAQLRVYFLLLPLPPPPLLPLRSFV